MHPGGVLTEYFQTDWEIKRTNRFHNEVIMLLGSASCKTL